MPDVTDLLIRYRELLAEVDAWFAQCSLVAGEQISCQRGCSACCRGLFDITLLDACLLQDGFKRLSPKQKRLVKNRSSQRLTEIQLYWSDFSEPWLMNSYPEEAWDEVMPEEDEIPCVMLGKDGLCLVYDSRPMTCRLNGVPMVDTSGEVLFDEWCNLNFTSLNPLEIKELRFCFNEIFIQEQLLFREFTHRLLGRTFNELDTLIPAAALIDFANFKLPEQLWSQSSS